MMKKLTALLLAILLLAAQMSVALAWNDHADTSWYDAGQTTFVLTTAAQLAGMSKLSYDGVDFEGKTIELGASIDLSGYNFEPIDLFKGTFDGKNYTIFNLSIEAQRVASLSKRYLAMFRKVENATVKNLTMDHCKIAPYGETSDQYKSEQAIVACEAQGDCLFENIKIQYCEAGTYNNTVGGVVGETYGDITFRNVKVDATNRFYAYWQSYDSAVGGILGYANGTLTVTFDNCVSAAVLDVYNDVCSNYQYWHYRRCGMLIGNNKTPDTVTVVASNTQVIFGDWNQYRYCEFQALGQGSYNGPDEWMFCRVDVNPERCFEGHTHQSFESCNELIPFENIIGGERGDRGGRPVFEVPNVTVQNDTEYIFPEPEFIFEGDDEYEIGGEEGSELTFKSSAEYVPSIAAAALYHYDKATETKGELIETFEASDADPEKIKFESGSIKVTLMTEFLNALEPGDYLLEIDPNKENDDSYEVTSGVFTIKESAPEVTPEPDPEPEVTPEPTATPAPQKMPQTGDNSNLMLWTVLLAVSVMGAIMLMKKRASAQR